MPSKCNKNKLNHCRLSGEPEKLKTIEHIMCNCPLLQSQIMKWTEIVTIKIRMADTTALLLRKQKPCPIYIYVLLGNSLWIRQRIAKWKWTIADTIRPWWDLWNSQTYLFYGMCFPLKKPCNLDGDTTSHAPTQRNWIFHR